MAEENKGKPRRKSFTEELEDAILDAGFPVVKGDGTVVKPEENTQQKEQE